MIFWGPIPRKVGLVGGWDDICDADLARRG